MAESPPSGSNRNLHDAYVPRTKPPSSHNTTKEKYPIINKPKGNDHFCYATMYGSITTQTRKPSCSLPSRHLASPHTTKPS